jgi:cytochrome oxidase Cu insertion factor (SCO1/SenC/PrrC family)
VQRLLQQNGYLGSRAHLGLVSVDPIEDTPSHLRSLARRTGALPGAFHYASGDHAGVQRVLKAYGISVTFHDASRADPDHTVAIYLLDPNMRIRYDFSLAYPPAVIARVVEQLANEFVRR